jgi:hypothetical protein
MVLLLICEFVDHDGVTRSCAVHAGMSDEHTTCTIDTFNKKILRRNKTLFLVGDGFFLNAKSLLDRRAMSLEISF